jgi:hypothetical protein
MQTAISFSVRKSGCAGGSHEERETLSAVLQWESQLGPISLAIESTEFGIGSDSSITETNNFRVLRP